MNIIQFISKIKKMMMRMKMLMRPLNSWVETLEPAEEVITQLHQQDPIEVGEDKTDLRE